jgi:hypothetical protein
MKGGIGVSMYTVARWGGTIEQERRRGSFSASILVEGRQGGESGVSGTASTLVKEARTEDIRRDWKESNGESIAGAKFCQKYTYFFIWQVRGESVVAGRVGLMAVGSVL